MVYLCVCMHAHSHALAHIHTLSLSLAYVCARTHTLFVSFSFARALSLIRTHAYTVGGDIIAASSLGVDVNVAATNGAGGATAAATAGISAGEKTVGSAALLVNYPSSNVEEKFKTAGEGYTGSVAGGSVGEERSDPQTHAVTDDVWQACQVLGTHASALCQHTHTHTHTHTQTHTHTHTHSLSLSHTHTLSLTHIYTAGAGHACKRFNPASSLARGSVRIAPRRKHHACRAPAPRNMPPTRYSRYCPQRERHTHTRGTRRRGRGRAREKAGERTRDRARERDFTVTQHPSAVDSPP